MLFAGMPFVADQLKRNIKALDQGAQRLMIADDRGDLHIQTAVVSFHQQIAKAVRLFGDQDYHPATTGWGQLAHRSFWQRAVQIGQ